MSRPNSPIECFGLLLEGAAHAQKIATEERKKREFHALAEQATDTPMAAMAEDLWRQYRNARERKRKAINRAVDWLTRLEADQ